ncbi:hypothetical protein [Corallococcus sp. AS-1-12]|uniref:hypothetical protein n=1 Tax=Corallococcus sp. AS-1-12 TaxID=2874598 RepID=UPI001CBB318B|nr:hypothetical protein [Corallococcus sp. AS-1-12]MBZ4332959.1 hypothetical protein [Corallococcus sp. AS-1-12]
MAPPGPQHPPHNDDNNDNNNNNNLSARIFAALLYTDIALQSVTKLWALTHVQRSDAPESSLYVVVVLVSIVVYIVVKVWPTK